MCSFAAPSGAVSDAVVVEGTVGSPAAVTFTSPLTILSTERTVIVDGDGEAVDSASLVEYAMTVFDAATGEQLQTHGYDGTPMLPVPAINLGQFLGCAAVGSRVVVAEPETDEDGATVTVLDLLSAQPARATGDEQKPVEGMPTVELAQSGAPTVTIPDAEPPADTSVAVLRMGDGAIVAAGDTAMVQYTGARWSDGTVFDSSWSNGAPTALVTTELIAGYKEALEGHTVGSQVLVVIPPEFAYGEGEINEEDLTGETLVFVVDILATMPAP
ncbi:FKBP-type peptidyl-prolyl cis-trans isomerase [Salinibacterium sp. ZJ454]|uniref:FKBP-type peptidyl-prolyl cis-trans isomerase n=1 Tax=Salinibacterium sp. ZJ454 TaxID=2708339 RepID=UPI001FB97896|nr:FKBP-type peptidyl-prolyl cis-trans isomerase [Salinibacterium sp. ZJ454]